MKHLLLIASMSLFASQAQAHHANTHTKFLVGEYGKGTTVLCDTAENVEAILKASITNGHEAGVARFNELNNQGHCFLSKFNLKMEKVISTFQGVPFSGPDDSKLMWVIQASHKEKTYFLASLWPLVVAGDDA